MSVISPILYSTDKISRWVHDGIIPPPTFDWDFARRRNLDAHQGRSAITETRASDATFNDSVGDLQVATTDEARFPYVLENGLWRSKGILSEEARTWRLLHNRDWTDAVYDTVTNITAVKDATGRDGVANSASSLTATAGNGVIGQSVTLASAERTSSIDVKRVIGSGDIDFSDDGGSNWATLTGLSSSVWTAHQITRTQANPDIRIRIVTSGDKINVDFGGLEEGAFRTSVVEVGATAVVRAADVPVCTDLGRLDQSKGTFLAGARVLSTSPGVGGNTRVFQVDDGGDTDRITTRITTVFTADTVNSGGNNGNSSLGTITAGVSFKCTLAYQQDDLIAGLDGSLDGTPDTILDMPTADTLTTFHIGMGHSSERLNGTIARIVYWPVRLPDGILQSLTA